MRLHPSHLGMSWIMLDHFLVQVIMYNAAISACGRCNQWLYAMNLLADMEATKVLPSSVTMTLGFPLSIVYGTWQFLSSEFILSCDIRCILQLEARVVFLRSIWPLQECMHYSRAKLPSGYRFAGKHWKQVSRSRCNWLQRCHHRLREGLSMAHWYLTCLSNCFYMFV